MKVLGLTLTAPAPGWNWMTAPAPSSSMAPVPSPLPRSGSTGANIQAVCGRRWIIASPQPVLRLADLDRIVASLCTDLPPTAAFVVEALAAQCVEVPPDRVVACPSHHLSHAASSFLCSPFEEAVVLVADNMGNALGNSLADPLWRTPFERTSLYHARQRPAPRRTSPCSRATGQGRGISVLARPIIILPAGWASTAITRPDR